MFDNVFETVNSGFAQAMYEDYLRDPDSVPPEWRGDPFHIVIAWKWSFVDDQNNRISLTLQHNTRDTEEKMGNAVKLSMTNLMEAERNCYEKKSAESDAKTGKEKQKTKKKGKVDWDLLVPK